MPCASHANNYKAEPVICPDCGQLLPHIPRGFARLSALRRQAMASLGGATAHKTGHAHEFTPVEARAAARKRHAPKP